MNLTLEERLQRVEDELSVRNCIARYGMAVDCGDTEAALACHTAGARYIVSAPLSGREAGGTVTGQGEDADLVLQGRAAIADMLESDMHQSMLPNCAHTVGPLQVDVRDDVAVVLGYSRLYLLEGESFRLLRCAINRWQLRRPGRDWLIDSRESRRIGEAAAQRLLKNGLSE